jgi:uncharacterized protein
MLTNSMREKVWAAAGSYYPEHDWAHGRSHIERVVGTALKIGKQEGADLDVIELAAILHDMFENKETHSNIEGLRHEIEGAKEARRILKELGVVDNTIDAVCHCIESHRKRTGTKPQTIEAKCLFDADKLDCIGAIGVIRSAFEAFDHGQEFYREEKDIESYKRNNIRADGTIIDFSKHSSNLEYELSLRHVAGRMHTKTGKKLARERTDFMDEFFKRLGSEMKEIL